MHLEIATGFTEFPVANGIRSYESNDAPIPFAGNPANRTGNFRLFRARIFPHLPGMYPVLFRLGGLEIHTYGVLVALGFLAGLTLAQRRARREGIPPERIGDLSIWLIVAAMAGAKLFYLVFYWNDFLANFRETGWASLRAGFVFFGGFIGAALTGLLYARAKALPIAKLADSFAPALALGHAFGRLGCYFEGCCYGKACDLPWAVHLPGHATAVHPTQLYEAAGNFALFAGLSLYRKRADGEVWWLYLAGYGCLRFVIEFFRGDYPVHYFGYFTTAQFIAAVLIVAGVIGRFRLVSPRQSR